MKFEEAMNLLKEGKKVYFARPHSLCHESVYYIDKNKDFHELNFDDDAYRWYDHVSTYMEVNYEMLTSDKWEEYKCCKEN